MPNLLKAIIVVLILVLAFYLVPRIVGAIALHYIAWRSEPFRSCNDCRTQRLSTAGTPVLNPYVWPKSGTDCINSIYADGSVPYGRNVPLTHLNTPDHALLTE